MQIYCGKSIPLYGKYAMSVSHPALFMADNDPLTWPSLDVVSYYAPRC